MPILETPPRPAQRKKDAPEGRIQAECVKIAWNEYPQTRGLYYAIPNENSRVDSNSATGAIRRSMGVVAGCADTFLAMARGAYFGLYIEFKSEVGRQREEQKVFQQRVEKQGYKYVVVHSVEEGGIFVIPRGLQHPHHAVRVQKSAVGFHRDVGCHRYIVGGVGQRGGGCFTAHGGKKRVNPRGFVKFCQAVKRRRAGSEPNQAKRNGKRKREP